MLMVKNVMILNYRLHPVSKPVFFPNDKLEFIQPERNVDFVESEGLDTRSSYKTLQSVDLRDHVPLTAHARQDMTPLQGPGLCRKCPPL